MKKLTTTLLAAGSVNLKESYGFGNYNSMADILNPIITPAFAIAGVALVIYFVIGAVKFIASGGDKNAIEGGRNMIVHTIIGFLLLMMLFLIMQFIPELFGLKGFKIVQ
ncbi:MAG: hypothetical protein Q7S44_02245 [bacterium]|nr:hypothetical protein [bacterium]